MSRFFNVNFV